MNLFAWALAGFVLIHVGISATGLRARIVGMIGEWPYRGLFSLASGALLTALIVGIGQMRADPFDPLNAPLWDPPGWLRWAAYVLVLFGLSLAFTGLFTPGPTLAGFEKAGLAKAEPAYGVLRITRHPFLWGVALWGAGHLLVNGERFAVMLFGALALMSVFGARSIDRKGAARDPEGWEKFEDVTSNAPFVAIVQGRNKLVIGEIGWRGLVGVAIAVAIALFHRQLFGVAAFST
ncbi:MAG: NnrU family protein [Alphaproteobacteria bacterium]|nr:NnrU family protein [Alphaproteobacteria bacterium]